MTATPRELVYQCLEFRNPPRAPRQLWLLPWAEKHHRAELEKIRSDFPPDIIHIGGRLRTPPITKGNPYEIGEYVDDWGCVFTNIQEGVVGEVREPLIKDWKTGQRVRHQAVSEYAITDAPKAHIPREWLTFDADDVNRQCAETDRFTLAGVCPRPFEQMQFICKTEEFYIDLADPPGEMITFMKQMHDFFCELLEMWARTDVDGLNFMDDWGSQRSLLINPTMWREIFKPMYRDYIQIAHAAGKKMFMHSDGHILSIIPDLIELKLDALNSQIFCMGLENLEPFAGKIAWWGEIDRQHLLPEASPAEIDAAVREVHRRLWRNGGCIAQCEFGAGARPENVRQTFASWDAVTGKP
ncbi:MAG: uroporphyrinogen decarboxylase family protein [bacterium]|nr:methyltransferase [Candidatus Sumerlaeota bacterium]